MKISNAGAAATIISHRTVKFTSVKIHLGQARGGGIPVEMATRQTTPVRVQNISSLCYIFIYLQHDLMKVRINSTPNKNKNLWYWYAQTVYHMHSHTFRIICTRKLRITCTLNRCISYIRQSPVLRINTTSFRFYLAYYLYAFSWDRAVIYLSVALYIFTWVDLSSVCEITPQFIWGFCGS